MQGDLKSFFICVCIFEAGGGAEGGAVSGHGRWSEIRYATRVKADDSFLTVSPEYSTLPKACEMSTGRSE